jgi:hypothetical protein
MYDIHDGKTHGDDPASSMTKREHIAAIVLQGLVSNSSIPFSENSLEKFGTESVRTADALIEALNKQ